MLKEINAKDDRAWLKHSNNAHGNGPILEDQLLNNLEKTIPNIKVNGNKKISKFTKFLYSNILSVAIDFMLYQLGIILIFVVRDTKNTNKS